MILRFLAVFFLLTGVVSGASFTSSQNGNWNDGATWGNTSPGSEGTDYPSTSGGDDVTISAGDEVTIPSGHSTISSGVLSDSTTGDRAKLIIVGTLDLDNDLTLNDWTELNISAGGTIDLNGNSIVGGVDNLDEVFFNWSGTSGNEAVILSTGSDGEFTRGTNAYIHTDAQYTDISDVSGYLVVGYGLKTSTAEWDYCSFTGCGQIYLAYNSYAEAAFHVKNCDFRNPNASGDRVPYLSATGTPSGSPERDLQNCTFSASSGYGSIFFDVEDGQITGNIINEYRFELAEPGIECDANFISPGDNAPSGQVWDTIGGDLDSFNGNYVYSQTTNAHPIITGFTGTLTMDENVFEGTDDETNFVIFGADSVNASENIFIGAGTPFSITSTRSGTFNLKRSTCYLNNDAGVDTSIPLFILTEGTAEFSGTVNMRSNIIVDSDTTTNDVGVGLVSSTADQIDDTDYNCWYGVSGGDVNDRYYQVSITSLSEGTSDNFDGNAYNINPGFADTDRDIADWDDSLGGAGTASNAIAEMLKVNGTGGAFDGDYGVSNLIAYVKAGFTPSAESLDGGGDPADSSPDVGAIDFSYSGGGNVPEFTIIRIY